MHPFITALCATLLLGACTPQYKVPEMTPEETRRIEQLTERMTTRCMGRYLIDLPEAFILSVNNPATIEGIPVKVTPMSRSQFDSQLERRTQELRKEHMDTRPDRPLLKGSEQTPADFVGRVFNRVESGGTAEFARVLELLAWKEGYRIDMQTKATDGTDLHPDPKKIGTVWGNIEKRVIEEYKNRKDTPEKLALLLSVYSRVEGRKETDIPESKGLCIANGFVRGEAIIEEGLNTSFDLKGLPDVSFDLSHLGDLHEEKSLLQRSGEVEKDMKASGTQTIRKGKKEIHGLAYEEWLMQGPTADRVPGTMFTLNGNEVAEGADKPFVSLQLLNGFRIDTPPDLSEEQREALGLLKDLEKATFSPSEAVALWDKVIPTLRRRPGAF